MERRREPAGRRAARPYLTGTGQQKAEEAVMIIGPGRHDAFGYVDPAGQAVIRKFLMETIDRSSTLIREERGQ